MGTAYPPSTKDRISPSRFQCDEDDFDADRDNDVVALLEENARLRALCDPAIQPCPEAPRRPEIGRLGRRRLSDVGRLSLGPRLGGKWCACSHATSPTPRIESMVTLIRTATSDL